MLFVDAGFLTAGFCCAIKDFISLRISSVDLGGGDFDGSRFGLAVAVGVGVVTGFEPIRGTFLRKKLKYK